MSITVEEFLRLKEIYKPKHSLNLKSPLTEELINQAARHLPFYLVCRLEAAKNTPVEEWSKLQLPRRDGLGNIKPLCVRNAVGNVFWKLARAVEHVAEKRSAPRPLPVRPTEDGTVQCPWCGGIMAFPETKTGDKDARTGEGYESMEIPPG